MAIDCGDIQIITNDKTDRALVVPICYKLCTGFQKPYKISIITQEHSTLGRHAKYV
jgi:hypothetical protein